MMTRFKEESGQALIISVLSMAVLMGFVALATDVGVMLHEKRLLQTAADAAAVAGAAELPYSDAVSAATAAATKNGFTAGTSTTITINTPPTSGYHKNSSSVEVIISQQVPTFFMRLFSWTQMTVSARAVAQNGNGLNSTGCAYILGSPGDTNSGMQLQGSFDVSAPSCGVLVNGNLTFTGSGGSMTAGYVGYAAGESVTGGGAAPSTPQPVQMAPVNDPLANKVTFPDPTKMSPACAPPSGAGVTSKTTGKVTTYTVTGNLAAGCYSGTVSLAGVTLTGGTYVFTGNLSFNNPAKGTYAVQTTCTSGPCSTGATIDIAGGALTDNTNGLYNLTAPSTGSFANIALMQPPSDTNIISIQTGNSLGTIDGIIYAPTAQLYLNDSGGDSGGGAVLKTDLIVGSLNDKTAFLTIQGFVQGGGGGSTLLTRTALVE